MFEGIDDGKDALATVAGLGNANHEVGVQIGGRGWGVSRFPKHPGPGPGWIYVVTG